MSDDEDNLIKFVPNFIKKCYLFLKDEIILKDKDFVFAIIYILATSLETINDKKEIKQFIKNIQFKSILELLNNKNYKL